jgi:hypothetical protein
MNFIRVVGSFLRIMIEETQKDFREHPTDPGPLLAAIAYLTGLLYFDVPLWKACAVTAIILAAMKYNFGRRRLVQVAVGVMVFTLAAWVGLIPSQADWQSRVARTISVELRSN